jgi:hypothetical protein
VAAGLTDRCGIVTGVKARLALVAAVALLAAGLASAASAAPAASSLRISLIGQTHTPRAGSPWAYYLRAWGSDGKPWMGAIEIQVLTPKGKKIDGVGQFAFTGSWLRAYIWRRFDRGQTLDLRIRFIEGTTVVATTSYRVSVK